MTLTNDFDKVKVSALYRFPANVVIPQLISEKSLITRTSESEGSTYEFGNYNQTSPDFRERQDQFDVAIEEIVERLVSADLDADALEASSGTLSIRIALVPNSGSAGIVIRQEIVERLSKYGAEILVSAWPGESWTDASSQPVD